MLGKKANKLDPRAERLLQLILEAKRRGRKLPVPVVDWLQFLW